MNPMWFNSPSSSEEDHEEDVQHLQMPASNQMTSFLCRKCLMLGSLKSELLVSAYDLGRPASPALLPLVRGL